MKSKDYFKLLVYGDCNVNEVIRDLTYNHPKKAIEVTKMLQDYSNRCFKVFHELIFLKP